MPEGDQHGLTSGELSTARSTLETLQRPLIIKVNSSDHPLSSRFRDFVEQLAAQSSGNLRPVYLSRSGSTPPSIEVQENLNYLAMRVGPELAPFLQTLRMRAQGTTRLHSDTVAAMQGYLTPTRVEVMIGPRCPHCPRVVEMVGQMALGSSYLKMEVIDVTLFPDLAARYRIRSVPAVVMDGREHLAGTVTEQTLVDRLLNQDPSSFHPDTFRQILKQGDAEKLADMMIADGKLYAGALELLADPEWSVRLGVMVVLEEVADRKPELASQARPFLLALLEHRDPSLRGDALYMLAGLGDASVIERVAPLTEDENPDVAEAAREALDVLRSRQGG